MAGQAEDSYQYALSSNASWASYKTHQNPTYFTTLAVGQTPTILWLGCSDSRVPETTLLGLQPGDVFVHRNIANIISPTDINCEAVIEYAVVYLKVKHVVLCGHTGCGGVRAALGRERVGGVLDTWLAPLRKLGRELDEGLGEGEEEMERGTRLAELNVRAGVEVLRANCVVEEAVRERGMSVHGVVFDIASGMIRDLGVGKDGSKLGFENGFAVAAGGGGGGMDGVVEDDDEVVVEDFELVRGKHGMLLFRGDSAELAVR